MVLLKSPSPKRGASPQRDNVGQRSNSRESQRAKNHPRSRGNSPGETSNGSRGSSPGKIGAKGKSPSLKKSRGSETGSIERLTDGDKRVIASRHLLPEDNINVVVRVRPLSKKETKSGQQSAVQFPGGGQIQCTGVSNSVDKKAKLFSYNVVFEPAASQEDVLQFSGIKKLIEMAVEGFGTTVFCYGQTGSGKTHTLTGPPGLFENGNPYSEDHGLVFRSFVYLFKVLQERKQCNFVLKASFLEIYNEKVIDLLNPGSSRKPLAVRWSKKSRGFFVENLFTVECEELDDLLAVLEEGMRNRSVGTHNMNEHSSRSHTILTVYITSEQQLENGVFISKQGKINFVDLAGSEMTKKTQSEGKTLEEANNINKSLMVLGYCIASLSDGKKKAGHIPYRDSKLTKLLADSLAGNGVSLMIACVSPARSNSSETLNTLRYAARAKKIRTKPIVVMDPREALILSLKRQVAALQTENDHLRGALHLGNGPTYIGRSDSKAEGGERRVPEIPAPPVDLDKLAELEPSELGRLLRAYITENEALRRENAELYATREQVMRDQELVCRENERLLKKLEDVNSVCCRSPIIPARPTYSAEMLRNSREDVDSGATNVWTNPDNGPPPPSYTTCNETRGSGLLSNNTGSGNIPDKLLKELDKRIVGSFGNIVEAYRDKMNNHRRHNSWDGRGSGGSPVRFYSPVDEANNRGRSRKSAFRRTSAVPENGSASKISDVLGGHVLPICHSLDGTPDSLASGPLMDGHSSAPDTGESVKPTTPFPPISPVVGSARMRRDSRGTFERSSINGDPRDLGAQRAFGSPVSIDARDSPLSQYDQRATGSFISHP